MVKNAIVVNIDRYLVDKPKNKVALVGVELEGGWEVVPEGYKVERDGSVLKPLDAQGTNRKGYPGVEFGEIVTAPIVPSGIGMIRGLYPDIIDETCALHMHMSFHTLYEYSILADSPNYQETLLEYLKMWAKDENIDEKHPIWDRLSGKNKYCKKEFWPDAQIAQDGKDHNLERYGHRYTAVHYCWRNKTVECRVLPMFSNSALAVRGLKQIVNITNAYLMTKPRSKFKLNTAIKETKGLRRSIQIRDGVLYEEFEIEE